MWFDARRKLAEIQGQPEPEPALPAGAVLLAWCDPDAMPPEELARELYEERAAIREYEGGQDRTEAERAAWIEARQAAFDPDNWR